MLLTTVKDAFVIQFVAKPVSPLFASSLLDFEQEQGFSYAAMQDKHRLGKLLVFIGSIQFACSGAVSAPNAARSTVTDRR